MFDRAPYREVVAGRDRSAQDMVEGRPDAAPTLVLTLPCVTTYAQARRLSEWRFRESIGPGNFDPPFIWPGAN